MSATLVCPHCAAQNTARPTAPTLSGIPVLICTACQKPSVAHSWLGQEVSRGRV